MEPKEIEKLLERYWKCETSVEEEESIRSFFYGGNIPDNLVMYKALFVWQKNQSEISASEDLSDRILSETEKKNKSIKLSGYFYPFLRIAASILIIITGGIGIQTRYDYEKNLEENYSYSETYSDPEAALEEARSVLGKVSTTLSRGQILDTDSMPADTTKALNE